MCGGKIMEKSMAVYIKERLQKNGITQKALSEKTGITESAISHYIKGDRVPRGVNLVKIAKALGTTTDDLLNEDRGSSKQNDLINAKALLARNASQMSLEEKMEFIELLSKKGES